MRAALALLLVPMLLAPAHAASDTVPTTKGTLDVRATYDAIAPGEEASIRLDFVNPATQEIQVHIDYAVHIHRDGQDVFGPIPRTHTTEGTVNIAPIFFDYGEGEYAMDVTVDGILFNPIPEEAASIPIVVGAAEAQPPEAPADPPSNGGGCLIATAAYGTEMAPQVQKLREVRDNVVASTGSGSAFLAGFNDIYYSFSPGIADLQREHPVFRDVVRAAITPMVYSLSIMDRADPGSEAGVLGYGASLIALNLAVYGGIPALGIAVLARRGRA